MLLLLQAKAFFYRCKNVQNFGKSICCLTRKANIDRKKIVTFGPVKEVAEKLSLATGSASRNDQMCSTHLSITSAAFSALPVPRHAKDFPK
jgi:hypothetical protein